jgi:hypothetical protein
VAATVSGDPSLMHTHWIIQMPRYHFNTHVAGTSKMDREGHEFANDAAARREAIKSLAEIAAEEVPKDGDRLDISINVTDDDDNALFSAAVIFHVDRVAKSPPASD